MADKSAENLINGIEASKLIPFERVLYALGIRYVGETVAKKLAKHYKSIEALSFATIEDLVNVDEIGVKIAESVIDFFSSQENYNIINRLKQFRIEQVEIILDLVSSNFNRFVHIYKHTLILNFMCYKNMYNIF